MESEDYKDFMDSAKETAKLFLYIIIPVLVFNVAIWFLVTQTYSVFTYDVQKIESKETHDYLLNIHYAKRLPQIMYAYGLFRDGELVGVITYGRPPAPSVSKGVLGTEHKNLVLELNRLCLKDNLKNEASQLVAGSFKLLPKPLAIISYADTSHDHLGIVYQATNFLYTGLSSKHTDWAVKGMEGTHTRTFNHIADALPGDKKNLEKIKELYGDRFYYIDRPRKHRYIILLGSKSEKRTLKSLLKYPVLPYPKRSKDA